MGRGRGKEGDREGRGRKARGFTTAKTCAPRLASIPFVSRSEWRHTIKRDTRPRRPRIPGMGGPMGSWKRRGRAKPFGALSAWNAVANVQSVVFPLEVAFSKKFSLRVSLRVSPNSVPPQSRLSPVSVPSQSQFSPVPKIA